MKSSTQVFAALIAILATFSQSAIATSEPSSITVNTIDNMNYRLEGGFKFKLKNGTYEDKKGFNFVWRQPTPIGRGDINGDGLKDAVVVLRQGIYRGQYAAIYIAAILNGRQSTSNVETIMVGVDKEDILSIDVVKGSVKVTVKTLLGGDPACCPTGKSIKTYRFRNNRLSPR